MILTMQMSELKAWTASLTSYLPASDVLDNPEIESAQNDYNEEAEGLVIHHQSEQKIGNKSQNFECNVRNAVARVWCTL